MVDECMTKACEGMARAYEGMRKYGEGGRIVTRAGANYQHRGSDARGVKTFWRAARICGKWAAYVLYIACIR